MVSRASYEQIVGEFSYTTVNGLLAEVTIQYPLITVELSNDKLYARGNALCDAHDDFSIDFGHALALTRALNRITKRMERKLIHSKR